MIMKTNVVLKSKDRDLFGIVIQQETKTGFLSVSELQKAYEVARAEHGWNQQDIPSLMKGKKFQERLYYILENQGFVKTEISGFTELCENQGLTKTLKQLGVWKTTGLGENKKVMCNPYIWVLIALELNPMIYAKVLTWLTDSLIFNRIEAGDKYRPLNDAISSIIENPEFYKYAILVNKKVFSKHETGIRDTATSEQLKEIARIEDFIVQGIKLGLLTTDDQVCNAIDKITK